MLCRKSTNFYSCSALKRTLGFLFLFSAFPLPVPLPFCVAAAACVSCVSSSLVSDSCCVSSPMSPCSVSPEDPSPPPPTPPLQLPAGSAETLVHNSIHPPLDSWPWWTSSFAPDCLSSWTSSLAAFYTSIHQISYFKKKKKTSKILTKSVCQQNISSNIYSISCKLPKIDVFTLNLQKVCISKSQAKCALYRLSCMRKRLSVSSRVSWETTILSVNPALIVLEASFSSVNSMPIAHE